MDIRNLISFDRRRACIGLLLGALSFLIFAVYYSALIGLLLFLFFLCIGSLKLKLEHNRIQLALLALWYVLFTLSTLILTNYIIVEQSTNQFYTPHLLLNCICILLPCFALFFLCGKWRFSFFGSMLFLMIFATVDIFIYQFRGKELLFADLMSIRTAMNVASEYEFAMSKKGAFIWLFWIGLCFSITILPKFEFPKKLLRYKRLFSLLILLSLYLSLVFMSSDITTQTWDLNGTINNGFYLNFYLSFRDSFVDRPEQYSKEYLSELEEQYEASNSSEMHSQPNIIVIMNESYADLSILGADLQTNIPVTPYYDSLSENCIKGYALTSVLGGNTANSEFEFLTGSTMAFLPEGCIPYQQYLLSDTFSIAHLAETYGYHTFATHPYLSSGWSRTITYPLLGFDHYSFIEDYPQEDLLRGFVSDREMYHYVMDYLRADDSDQPLFLFGISIQNHGGYSADKDKYIQSIDLTGYSQEYPKATQYLDILHQSDQALEYLLTELQTFPDDTIVLLFGDHMPKLETDFIEEIHGGTFDSLDAQQLQYTVPFLIWANYDIPEDTVELTSLNYLSLYLLEVAGLDLSPYHQFLSSLREVVPSMNVFGYYSLSQGRFLPYEEATGAEAEWLKDYSILQYNNLLDHANRSNHFFEQYFAD